MLSAFRKLAFAAVASVLLAAAASGQVDDGADLYRRGLDLFRADGQVCPRGSVEQRLECVGREIYRLNRRLEEMARPRVRPLGPAALDQSEPPKPAAPERVGPRY